ncbi:hypothetical protein DPMN_118138 [Dreissena polymorpha]|uniref:Uncharacterized protein n=1 Tax=Dreissena polymorpha TaxID=45954 RepID=A0A9D4JLL2_DREPO|nr:hypothetical protein DPMN_118138 [Dreissena polymorpha]
MHETPGRCKTVSQTVGTPVGDSKRVCDSAISVWAPVGDFPTLPDILPYPGDSQTV